LSTGPVFFIQAKFFFVHMKKIYIYLNKRKQKVPCREGNI